MNVHHSGFCGYNRLNLWEVPQIIISSSQQKMANYKRTLIQDHLYIQCRISSLYFPWGSAMNHWMKLPACWLVTWRKDSFLFHISTWLVGEELSFLKNIFSTVNHFNRLSLKSQRTILPVHITCLWDLIPSFHLHTIMTFTSGHFPFPREDYLSLRSARNTTAQST